MLASTQFNANSKSLPNLAYPHSPVPPTTTMARLNLPTPAPTARPTVMPNTSSVANATSWATISSTAALIIALVLQSGWKTLHSKAQPRWGLPTRARWYTPLTLLTGPPSTFKCPRVTPRVDPPTLRTTPRVFIRQCDHTSAF